MAVRPQVFFGNCDALKETFRAILDKGGDKVCAIVIDAAGASPTLLLILHCLSRSDSQMCMHAPAPIGVSHIDLSGIESLEDMKGGAWLMRT